MLKTPEEINNFINFHKNFIGMNRGKAASSDERLKSRWLWGFGTNAQSAAFGYLMLNDRDSALEWFNKSAEFYLKCLDSYEETGQYFGLSTSFTETAALQVMKSCVLSGNKINISKISLYVIKNKPEISLGSDLIYNYVLALSAVITSDKNLNEIAFERIKKLTASEEKHSKNTGGYYEGTAIALAGIVENNENKIFEGLNKVLASFDKSGKDRDSSDDFPFCIDAVMLLLIAEYNGIELDPGNIDKNYPNHILTCRYLNLKT
jgi:hypothetical protein